MCKRTVDGKTLVVTPPSDCRDHAAAAAIAISSRVSMLEVGASVIRCKVQNDQRPRSVCVELGIRASNKCVCVCGCVQVRRVHARGCDRVCGACAQGIVRYGVVRARDNVRKESICAMGW